MLTHGLSVFAYALKHGYMDLALEVAPLILDYPLQRILSNIPSQFFLVWVCICSLSD